VVFQRYTLVLMGEDLFGNVSEKGNRGFRNPFLSCVRRYLLCCLLAWAVAAQDNRSAPLLDRVSRAPVGSRDSVKTGGDVSSSGLICA
jgi:hypothetical protein